MSDRRPPALHKLVPAIVLAALLIAGCVASDCYAVERTIVTVVHTNDIHSQLSSNMDGVEPVGGMARIAALVNHIRTAEPYVIVLDAGDAILGTPFFTFYDGRAEVECMNAIGYDAVAVGNHELDRGPRALLDLADEAKFSFLSANLVWRHNGKPLFDEYLLFETENDINIAVLGLTPGDISGLVRPSAVSSLTAKSPIATASELVPVLSEAANAVIVLSHLGLDEDKKLARQVPGINLIVGGHSHDLLEKPIRVPSKDTSGRPMYTYIVQAGSQATHLGRADLIFDDGKLTSIDAELIPVTSVVAEDPEVARIVGKYWKSMESTVTDVVAYASGRFSRDSSLRTGESPLGNMLTDAIRVGTGADFALQNAGGIRSGFGPGPVTVWDVYCALPFDNKIVELELKGDQVKELVADIARRVGRGCFCQVSGISFEVVDKRPSAIKVGDDPLDDNKTYTVAVADYLAEGGCQFEALTDGKVLSKSSKFQRDYTVDYLRDLKILHPKREGRISIKQGSG
jgi:5'-nucleotidase/UDP-sugar diphosphatase